MPALLPQNYSWLLVWTGHNAAVSIP